MSHLLNGPSTVTIFSSEIDRVLKQAGCDSSIKATPTRSPTIFMGNAVAGIGDTLPYLRVVKKELLRYMEANYHILLNCITDLKDLEIDVQDQLYGDSLKSSRQTSTKVYTDQDKWVHALLATHNIDIVIFNQDVNWIGKHHRGHEEDLWVKMYEAITKKNAVFVHLEFLWQGPGTSDQDDKWFERLQSREATVEEYLSSLRSPKVNAAEVKRGRRNTLPRIYLECYPAWILTGEERKRVTGVLCGRIAPLLPDMTAILDYDLSDFINQQSYDNRKFILLARGGNSSPLWNEDDQGPTDTITLKLARSLLQIPDIVVLVLGEPSSHHQLLQAGVFAIPYLKVNFEKLLAIVNLVLHHGGAGTTFAALCKGTPQIIVPNTNDCPDQLFHGGKVSELGCGTFLRPRSRKDLDDDHQDVVQAARSLLERLDEVKSRCAEVKEKMLRDEVFDPNLAVQGLMRISEAVVGLKAAGTWKGWTPEAIEKDRGRSLEEVKALKQYGDKRKN